MSEDALLAEIYEMVASGLEFIEAVQTRRALDHPDHVKLTKPVKTKMRRLLAAYFHAQGDAIVQEIDKWLKLHMREADDNSAEELDAEQVAASILPDTLTAFSLQVTSEQAQQYRDLITVAIQKAEAGLEAELNSGSSIPETRMTRYILEHSLEKLTGDFSETTKTRLRRAIVESINRGGTSEDIVQAIEDEVDEFSSTRAELIAQTEVNNAYAFGRQGMAEAAGLEEKGWVVESGNPCAVCLENEAKGWIPITDRFPSGNLFPTAHPNCACGCDYRKRQASLPTAAAA